MPRSTTGRAAWIAVGATVAAWTVYKASVSRRVTSAVLRTTNRLTSGAAAFASGGRPWDVGTGVAGYVWPAKNPRANVLLQHGYGEFAGRFVTQYRQLIPHLVEQGFSVYAFDAWGHGGSAGVRALTDIEAAVDDHLAARRVLEASALPLFLFGHSLGGLITAASAARAPSDVAGVVLSGPALKVDLPPAAIAAARVAAFLAPTVRIPLGPPPAEKLFTPVPGTPQAAPDSRLFGKRFSLLLAATGASVMSDSWRRYPDWTHPTLVIHGGADDPAVSEEFFARIASTDKTLRVFPETHHEILNDLVGDEALELVVNWLDERAPRKATS